MELKGQSQLLSQPEPPTGLRSWTTKPGNRQSKQFTGRSGETYLERQRNKTVCPQKDTELLQFLISGSWSCPYEPWDNFFPVIYEVDEMASCILSHTPMPPTKDIYIYSHTHTHIYRYYVDGCLYIHILCVYMLKHIIHTWVFILWDHSLLTWTKSEFCCQNTENQNLKMQKSSPWASFQPQSCSTWLHNVFINLDKHLYVGKFYTTSESLSFWKTHHGLSITVPQA